ncbi:MAG: hypothetical protein KGQ93_09655 [Cyanobacteria bacterium REEB459]|nr:hypothetical protein [Cyanobacteria bacterium REEB459]
MKDFTPWSPGRTIELNRFDALVVVIVTTLLAIIAAPNRSNSFDPQPVDSWTGRGVENLYSIPQIPSRSGHQVEIRSANPDASLSRQTLRPTPALVANAPYIARWSYYLNNDQLPSQATQQTIGNVSVL